MLQATFRRLLFDNVSSVPSRAYGSKYYKQAYSNYILMINYYNLKEKIRDSLF